MNSVDRLRRSLLYVPGDRPEMLAKAATRGADSVILNLEDAVAPGSKEQARRSVAETMSSSDFSETERIVRINSLESDLALLDLLAVVPGGPEAILLPKVTSSEQVKIAAWMIGQIETLHALPAGKIRIMCMVETASGIQLVREIAGAHPRVAALVFGAADFCADVGCSSEADRGSLEYAKSQLLIAARSAHIAAVDAPYMNLRDMEGLERSVRISRELGFDGKSAIHPAQVAVINAGFSPSAEEVRWAESVIAVLADTGNTQTSRGAALLDDSLIEEPHMLRARRILEAARRAESEEQ